ncbi:MAG TPA: Ig-like domain-containing protein, partial [Blastocatellia bacterium]|nr:Ig-like domain-containing protein [Blastocatellia bacterium]
MFDTMQRSRSRFLVFAVTAAFVISVFPLPRFGNVYVARRSGSASHSKTTLAPAPASNGGGIAVQSISYDMCLQDDSNGSTLSLNTTTGDYIFTCGNCVKKTGRGTLSVKGCTVSLQHNPSDRRVSASLDKCARKGTAALQSPPGTTQCTIRDTNLAAESCSTDLTPPQVNITAPNGGEIVDTGSSFTISWNATDDVAVASQDVLLSTDGGSTWSTIAAGLAGAVNQYAWTAPVIVNNQSVKVRVVARDAACNVSSDNSDANFTVWNPPASFTHSAEAPIYITSGGFDAFIYLCNESMSSIVAELDFRQPLGDATAGAPAQLALSAGDARKIRVADYLTLGSSTGSVEGSIRLRHNGSGDSDVQAMLVVNKFGEEQSFTAPFVYPASSQAADSTMQCSPLFYVDDLMTTSLGLQNCRNYPVDVNVKLVYGTGDPATPNGTLYLPTITLGGQGRLSTNLAAFKAQLQGAKWGSIVVSAPAQSIVAHTVMRSAVKGVACSSSFVDPRISTSTTKVASALKLDYDSLTKPCIMVCNASSTDTRTVTANFQTDSGVPIPSQQVTLAPGQQKMIVVDPRQVLSAHQSAMADVRLTYTGNGSDIVAGGVSMSAAEDYASGARFVEPRSTDGKHLMSPFFRVDARTPGFVQISNLGSSSVMAGVSMKFANSTLPPVTSEMVSVLAGRTATLDVQKYIEQTPDGLTAEGCLSLIHNGAPGTVTCSFVSMTPDPVETPLEPGPPMCHTTVFPNEIDTQAGETTVVRVITCGGQGAVVFTASAGTITPQPSSDPDVSVASYTVPDDESEPDTAIITVTSADGVSTSEVEIQKVKLRSIGTSTGGRLNPDGGTTFVLTGKKDFPTVPLQVRFRKNGTDVSVDIPVGSISGATLTGTAPPNTLFIGDAAVLVFADGGNTKISKKTLCDDTGCSAYYAFDPPTPPTSVSAPGAFNRTGGNLTITAAQGGFRRFDSTIPGAPPILPKVNLDGIGFEVNIVTAGVPATINGNVQRAPKEIPSCAVEGQTPCKFVHVRNPGGRAR